MKNIKKTVVRTLSASLAAVLCGTSMLFVSPQPAAAAVTGNATTNQLQDQINTLDKQQKELKNKIKAIEKETAATLENKSYLDSLVTTINAKVTAAEQLIEQLNTQIEETQASIAEHEALIAETTVKIKERMRQNHEDGNANYLNVLIGSEGVGDFLSRLERINTMIEYDTNTLESYEQKKSDLEDAKAALEESKALQENTLKTLKNDQEEAAALSQKAENFINSLKSDKASYDAMYAKAAADEAAINEKLEAELARLAAASPSQATGDYIWPLPSGGYISCYFGGSDPGGKAHYAVDCAIARGTPIYAAGDGTIVTAGVHSSYGNYIVINHGGGHSTLYAHCSALAVSTGQAVSKGQVIGYVGSTGYSTGNHLHFEFRVNGVRKNPFDFVSR